MITDIFYWTLNMSIAGTAVGLAVLVLRRIKKLPRRLVSALWLLPLVRLVVPFALPSRFSLLTLAARITTRSVPAAALPEFLPELSYTNFIMAVNQYGGQGPGNSLVFKTEALSRVFAVSGVVWAVIFAAALLTCVILYVVTKSALRDAVHLRDNIYLSDRVSAPALYGVFRPRIVIPPWVCSETLLYAEAHENAHRRRGDNLWRLLAIATACMHWFNPFAWVMLKVALEDAELACDEAVLQKIGPEKKKAYAEALIGCAEGRTLFAPAFAAVFGGAKLRVRIENILSYKKLTLASAAMSLLLLAALALTLLTNAGA